MKQQAVKKDMTGKTMEQINTWLQKTSKMALGVLKQKGCLND